MKTITTKELLYEAYFSILDKWTRASENYEITKALGLSDTIMEGRIYKYKAQLDEIHGEILKTENAE